MSEQLASVSFFDAATNDCPYHAHALLRNHAPVWKDSVTGMYVITRYEDVRAILADVERFSNQVSGAATFSDSVVQPEDRERARELVAALEVDRCIRDLYETEGTPPVATMDAMDDPLHFQLRNAVEAGFRPAAIAALEPYLRELAGRLVDRFVDRGGCEFVSEFAVPLPLFAIGKQMGLSEEDMLRVKPWTEAFVQRLGLMQSPEQRLWSARQEIEFQKFFMPIYARLRATPDDSLLSDLVNRPIPEWGRPLNDAELNAEMMIDFMVGGSETTTNAVSAGVLLLARDPQLQAALTRDLDTSLPTFVEEVLRLESPVQSLLRQARVAVELHGVTIPAGAIVNLRYGAANRDERQYERAAEVDLQRKRTRTHLAFGAGAHVCLGAPLARRELYWGFRVLLERLEAVSLAHPDFQPSYHPNYFLRSMRELPIRFRRRSAAPR